MNEISLVEGLSVEVVELCDGISVEVSDFLPKKLTLFSNVIGPYNAMSSTNHDMALTNPEMIDPTIVANNLFSEN